MVIVGISLDKNNSNIKTMQTIEVKLLYFFLHINYLMQNNFKKGTLVLIINNGFP